MSGIQEELKGKAQTLAESVFKTRKSTQSPGVGMLLWNIILAVCLFFVYQNKVPATSLPWKHSVENNKITLLGMVINNNSYIVKNGYPVQDMVFINADWTLNKFPKYLELDDSSKQLLQKYVKE